ncbi:hypothetical protein CY0110_18372 [Crocosphaera chwakensis CCY0110]|uniref:Uncharacterized protein n=1 Tax=Crocosphaera chwakensis CCY0110 TaxID=391612 RepID=A3IJ06_9CHRO|nr:hypothetical protein CY0110_18372 [Crocosphaera chwakensis CCY0110]
MASTAGSPLKPWLALMCLRASTYQLGDKSKVRLISSIPAMRYSSIGPVPPATKQ